MCHFSQYFVFDYVLDSRHNQMIAFHITHGAHTLILPIETRNEGKRNIYYPQYIVWFRQDIKINHTWNNIIKLIIIFNKNKCHQFKAHGIRRNKHFDSNSILFVLIYNMRIYATILNFSVMDWIVEKWRTRDDETFNGFHSNLPKTDSIYYYLFDVHSFFIFFIFFQHSRSMVCASDTKMKWLNRFVFDISKLRQNERSLVYVTLLNNELWKSFYFVSSLLFTSLLFLLTFFPLSLGAK